MALSQCPSRALLGPLSSRSLQPELRGAGGEPLGQQSAAPGGGGWTAGSRAAGTGGPWEQECGRTPVRGQPETWREAHRDCLLQRAVRPGLTRREDWEEETRQTLTPVCARKEHLAGPSSSSPQTPGSLPSSLLPATPPAWSPRREQSRPGGRSVGVGAEEPGMQSLAEGG